MTPSEIAMKMMSACNTCQGTKCLYRTQCKGTSQSCPLKEVAMTLRAQEARIRTLEAELAAANGNIETLTQELDELEKVNKDYYKLVVAFQSSYRPVKATKKGKPRRGRPMKKKDPVEMDGDERYGIRISKKEEEHPLVLI